MNEPLHAPQGPTGLIDETVWHKGKAYRKACDQLVLGRGNLVKQVSDFRQLGVAVKGELAEDWVERAELELNLPAADTEQA